MVVQITFPERSDTVHETSVHLSRPIQVFLSDPGNHALTSIEGDVADIALVTFF